MLGGASRTCRTSPTCFHLSRGFLCRRGTENRENWHELTAFQRERERSSNELEHKQSSGEMEMIEDSSVVWAKKLILSVLSTIQYVAQCRPKKPIKKTEKNNRRQAVGNVAQKKDIENIYILYILYDIYIYIYYIHKFSRNVQQKLQIAGFEVRSLGEQEFREDVLEIVDGGIWKAKWRFPRHVWRYFHVIFLWFSVMSSHVLMFLSFFSSLSVILNLSPSVEGRFCNFVTLSFLSKNLGLLHSFWGFQNTRIPNDTNTFVDTTLVET